MENWDSRKDGIIALLRPCSLLNANSVGTLVFDAMLREAATMVAVLAIHGSANIVVIYIQNLVVLKLTQATDSAYLKCL